MSEQTRPPLVTAAIDREVIASLKAMRNEALDSLAQLQGEVAVLRTYANNLKQDNAILIERLNSAQTDGRVHEAQADQLRREVESLKEALEKAKALTKRSTKK